MTTGGVPDNRPPWANPDYNETDWDGNGHVKGPLPGSGVMEVNECSAFPGLCGHGRCKNMMGSFDCDCFPGYEKVSSYKLDICFS